MEDLTKEEQEKILELMKDNGYFKKGDFRELSDEQENRNYEKAQLFIERGIIPSWLKEDMEYYLHLSKQLESD